jgi:hypothetical protein
MADPVAAIQTFTDETGAPATLPEIGGGGEEGKLKVLLGLLKKCAPAHFTCPERLR